MIRARRVFSGAPMLWSVCRRRFWIIGAVTTCALIAAVLLTWPSQPFRFVVWKWPVRLDDCVTSNSRSITRCYAFQADFDEVSRQAAHGWDSEAWVLSRKSWLRECHARRFWRAWAV